jgi:hypothetical protein
VNDIIGIINDLKEIREAVKNNQSFYIEIDRKIAKYQKIIDDFEESQDNMYNTNVVRNNAGQLIQLMIR